MREIKFRAWDKKRNVIISAEELAGISFRGLHGFVGITYFTGDDCGDVLNKNECELMAFTGLHDRNGKEIYESDIVKEGNRSGVIVWHQEYAAWRFENKYGSVGVYHLYGEVIGNVWENSDLLEGEK